MNSNGNPTVITAMRETQTEICEVVNDLVPINVTCRGKESEIVEGRVEICKNNDFGTVCNDRWDLFEARVVCSQLNSATNGNYKYYHQVLYKTIMPFFIGSLPILRSSILYGEFDGNNSPLLTDLDCNGNEGNLFDCSRQQTRMCDHSEDAGVRCGGEYNNYSYSRKK